MAEASRTAEAAAALPPASVPAGIGLLVLAVLCFAVIDAMAKVLIAELPLVQVVWARYFFFLLPLALVVAPGRWPTLLRESPVAAQIGRGALPLLAGSLVVLALDVMPLADVTAITFAAPLMVTALSLPLLGERVGPHRWGAVAVGFVGVLIVVRPGGDAMRPIALLPLATAFLFALYQIATRKLAGRARPEAMLLWTAAVGAVATSLLLPFAWQTPSLLQLLLMAASGVIHGVSHHALIQAFGRAPASLLSPFVYTQIVAATALGYLLFGDLPDRWTVAGTTVIIGSGLYVFWREAQARRR